MEKFKICYSYNNGSSSMIQDTNRNAVPIKITGIKL